MCLLHPRTLVLGLLEALAGSSPHPTLGSHFNFHSKIIHKSALLWSPLVLHSSQIGLLSSPQIGQPSLSPCPWPSFLLPRRPVCSHLPTPLAPCCQHTQAPFREAFAASLFERGHPCGPEAVHTHPSWLCNSIYQTEFTFLTCSHFHWWLLAAATAKSLVYNVNLKGPCVSNTWHIGLRK